MISCERIQPKSNETELSRQGMETRLQCASCHSEENGSAKKNRQRYRDDYLYFAKAFPDFFGGNVLDNDKLKTTQRVDTETFSKDILMRALENDSAAQKENYELLRQGWLKIFGIK